MSDSVEVNIDFSNAGLNLERSEMEGYILNLSDEMQSGRLVIEACLARESDVPEYAKVGGGAFILGILKAEINIKNIRKVMNYLADQFYGKTLTLSGKMDGMTYNIEYRTEEDIDLAVDTIKRLSNLRIEILEQKKTLGE